jgi:putative membrane protein
VILILGLASSFAGVPEWLSQASFALIPVSLAVAADRFASLGHAVIDGYLVGRWGTLVRRRWALSTDGIIGWNIRRSFFQRRAGLVTLTATTAGGRQAYWIQDVDLTEALRVAQQAVPGLLRPFLQPADARSKARNPDPACPHRAEAHR